MKTRILYFAMAAATLFSLGACNQKEDGPSGDRVPLKISASIGGYDTKALDTSFEEGDLIGLFASAPLNLVNEKLTWSGGSLVPGQTLYWPLGSEETADFRAYYPYNQELKALEGKIPFQVKLDQSQYANYTASDLMFAAARASAKDEKVNLVFDHKLSKIAVKVENNTGEAIREVLFAVQSTTAVVDAANGEVSEAVVSENVDVMHAYVSGDSFYAIVPPQKTPVQVAISTVGGKTFIFEAKEVELLSGKQSRGTLTLNAAPVGDKVEFSFEIVPWEEGGNIRFTDAVVGERSGYDVYLINTRERIHMTETNPGEFFYNFPNYNGEQFYVLNESNNYIYGCTLKMPQDVGEWPCVNNGFFQLDGYTGDLNIWFYPDEGILKYDPVYPEWKELGECEIVRGMFSNYYGFIPEVTKAKVSEDARHPGMYIVYSPFEEKGVQNEYIDFYNEIVIDARNPEKVYMQPVQWLYDLNAGKSFTLFSDVVENGEDGEPYGENNYGTLKDGVIRLGYLTARYDDGSETVFNADKAFQLVLPGYKREPVLGFSYIFNGLREEGNTLYADFILKPYPDIQSVRYSFFSGKPTSEEIMGDILQEFVGGAGEPVPGIEMGKETSFSIAITQSGRYTAFFYAEAPDGDGKYLRYQYNYFVADVPGSTFPSASISLTDAAPSALFPDKAAAVHLDFPYASNLRVRAVSVAAAQESGLTEDDYYSFAMDGSFAPGFMSYVGDNSGADLAVTGLSPDTDYLIIAAGDDVKGISSWTSATIHTAAEPSWSDFGEGTWAHYGWLTGGYSSPVLIQKASGAERYRAVQPYAAYWDSSESKENYAGYSDDFEFTFVEHAGNSYIYYLPCRIGFVEEDLVGDGVEAVIELNHSNIASKTPSFYSLISYNKAISEGVYNIAPYGRIVGTQYYYNWMTAQEMIVLAMPGYNYASAGVPALKIHKPEAAETAPVIGEHKLQPFKRLPVKMGKPIVKPVNN